jgi:hypothetical protein
MNLIQRLYVILLLALPTGVLGMDALYEELAATIVAKEQAYRECYGQVKNSLLGTPFLYAWCTDDEIHRHIAHIKKKVRFIDYKLGAYQFGFHVFQQCVGREEIRDCVSDLLTGMLERANESSVYATNLYSSHGDLGKAKNAVERLVGEYRETVQIQLPDDGMRQVDDVIRLVPVEPLSFYADILTTHQSGHACKLQGIFEYKSDDTFAFHDPDYQNTCVLIGRFDEAQFIFDEVMASCQKFCGAKSSLDKLTIQLENKEGLSNVAAVRSSLQYKRAVRVYESKVWD